MRRVTNKKDGSWDRSFGLDSVYHLDRDGTGLGNGHAGPSGGGHAIGAVGGAGIDARVFGGDAGDPRSDQGIGVRRENGCQQDDGGAAGGPGGESLHGE